MLNLSRCEINCNRILTTSDAIAPPPTMLGYDSQAAWERVRDEIVAKLLPSKQAAPAAKIAVKTAISCGRNVFLTCFSITQSF